MPQIGFSIGIPAYERPDYTRQALRSCLMQEDPDFEVIVCDDSVSEDVSHVVKEFHSSPIRYYRNPNRCGLPQNANALLKRASKDWMIILANDDLLQPGYLKAVRSVIERRASPALIRTRYLMIDENGRLIRMDRTNPFQMNSFEFLSKVFLRYDRTPWMSISGVAFQRDALLNLGGFKEFHRGHHMDRVAWAQLGALGNCYFIQEPLVKIRCHGDEITTTADPDYDKALLATFRMSGFMEELLDEMNLKTRTIEEEESVGLARQRLREYVVRQLKRSFDQGIMAQIQKKRIKNILEINRVRKQIRNLGTPVFPSFYLYSFMLLLPQAIRLQLLPWFKEYKLRRWHL